MPVPANFTCNFKIARQERFVISDEHEELTKVYDDESNKLQLKFEVQMSENVQKNLKKSKKIENANKTEIQRSQNVVSTFLNTFQHFSIFFNIFHHFSTCFNIFHKNSPDFYFSDFSVFGLDLVQRGQLLDDRDDGVLLENGGLY